MSDETPSETRSTLRAFAADWLSIDNVSLAAGVGLLTAGAACWSPRAALVTCGALLIGLTLARLKLERRAA
jgi:hypothetical protein